jgi:hypothetical protein
MISARFKTDCTRCHGLCCTVFAHLPVNGFPVDKPADTPCRHLTSDHRCAVFETLEDEGFTVCRHYDCFGAGPMVTRWMMRIGQTPACGAAMRIFASLPGYIC